MEVSRGVEGGGPEDEPSRGFTIGSARPLLFMATFQGRCNTKEPQQLSRPVRLLPAHSNDCLVAPITMDAVEERTGLTALQPVRNLPDGPGRCKVSPWKYPGALKGEAPKTSLVVASQ
ncbi:uncharacterized protein LOC144108844 [Amblyomma americanum]